MLNNPFVKTDKQQEDFVNIRGKEKEKNSKTTTLTCKKLFIISLINLVKHGIFSRVQ